MTLQKNAKQATEASIESTQTPQPHLINTVYSLGTSYPSFFLNVIELYSDNTWKIVGKTDNEPLPMLFNRIERLIMKGTRL